MRVLVAMGDKEKALQLEQRLWGESWDGGVEYATDGRQVLRRVLEMPCELLVLNACLPYGDGNALLRQLAQATPCPPRVLLLTEPELTRRESCPADCVAPLYTSPEHLTRLLLTLSRRMTPRLALLTREERLSQIDVLMAELGLPAHLKGTRYLRWLLDVLVPTPALSRDLTHRLYPACAQQNGATAASVERCVRHAVEETFTYGELSALERCFGGQIDPERGKLTNRAFLLALSAHVRQALASARSLNSSEMHHSPAAPMIV